MRLLLKVIICLLWLLCIASAAWALPGISQQPSNQTVCSGTSTSFTITSVVATTGAVTIRWQESTNNGATYTDVADGVTYSGTATVTLTIPNVSTGLNDRLYRCLVTDVTGTTQSNAARLNVNQTPAVENSPKRLLICVGAQNNPRSVGLVAGYTYQWQLSTNNGVSWNNITAADGYVGSTTNSLLYPTITMGMNNNLIRYTATLGTCSNTSVALDTVIVSPLPVWKAPYPGPIANQICPGDDITFTDTATGISTILYKWQMKPLAASAFTDVVDNAVYSGSQTQTLQITDFNGAQGSAYHVRLTAAYPAPYVACAANTNSSVLQVRTLPAVSSPPTNVTTCANTDTAFRVAATGSVVLNYQWQTDNGSGSATWTNVGSNSTRLPLIGVTTAMNGWKYRVTVSNACSPAASSYEVTLTVRRSGTWLGAKDTAWQEPMNWCGGVPDATIDVLVPNWPTKMPLISDGTGTAYYKSLEIENTARLTISGGIINNMSGPFDLQGTVAYIATSDQEIYPANHGSLEINGSGNKFLSSAVDVSHNLVLGGSAKLVTRANIITMKTGSNTVVAAPFTDSSTSWIVTGNGNTGAANTGLGGLRIEQVDAADGAVLFPIGPTPAAYNPIQLTNAGTVDHFAVAVNDQMIPGGIYASGVTRTWLVSEAVNGGSNVMLSLKWQGNEEQSAFDRAQTSIIRSNGTQIVEMSSRAPASGSNPYARADGSFNVLSQFSVSSSSAVLPTELKAFTAQKTANATVGLTWNTTGATAPKYFEVQRSVDGIRFINIGKVNGEAGKGLYNYTDNLPGSGTVYYRLAITGDQNEIIYSGIQSVVLNGAGLVQLRPSATASATTSIYLHTTRQLTASLYVTDISGRIYHRQSLRLNKGEQLLPLWIGNLSKGVYYVHVKDEQGNASVLTLMKW
jgi:hypothetical protein